MDATLSQTPLHSWHVNRGGRLVDFAGWDMPVQYSSISDEHLATRKAAALFDVSHMGRFRFVGNDAAVWLQGLVTRRIDDMQPGDVRYSLVTRDDGGILDDVLIYRLADERLSATESVGHWRMVVNASNREKLWNWCASHDPPSLEVCEDETLRTAMIAVQGPLARQLVMDTIGLDAAGLDAVASLNNYQVTAGIEVPVKDGPTKLLVSRTGYTGEDGFELIVEAPYAETMWTQLLAAGEAQGVVAAGLGARDTLRLEAAMPLYGHELSEERNAAACGLKFALHLDHSFPGRDQIEAFRPLEKRIGFVMEGRRVARQGAQILTEERPIGVVTSGTFSPSLQQAIGMAYVDAEKAKVGQSVEIDVRGKRVPAKLVALPFYRQPM